MLLIGFVFAALAAVLHIVIFWMESVAWTGPLARRTFGPASDEVLETTRELAFNQGFYNLFLAVVTIVGIVLGWFGVTVPGTALVLAGAGSMLAAAAVLFVTSPGKRRAAITQGALPLVAVLLTVIALAA